MELTILAAGKSSRFKKKGISHKCLTEINGLTLINKIIKDFRSFKISNVKIVVGYKKKKLEKTLNDKKLKFIYNRFYASRDMLHSFYLALLNQTDDMVLSYSDIFYSKKIVKKITNLSKGNKVVLPVSMNWEKIWKIRKKNIYDDCETLVFDKKLNLLEIGNRPKNKKKIMAQYMGIIYVPFKIRNNLINEIKKEKDNKLHITNFLNKFIKKFNNIKIIKVNDIWYEFDDLNDYEYFIKRN